MLNVDTLNAEMSAGTAAYHAARILDAIGKEITALKQKIHVKLEERLEAGDSGLRTVPWGEVTTRAVALTPGLTARVFDIPIAPVGRSEANRLGTITLIFDFHGADRPSDAAKEALLFVCWDFGVPRGEERWAQASFIGNELTKLKPHSSGLVGFEKQPTDRPILEEQFPLAYAVRLDEFRKPDSVEKLIVRPLVALLGGVPPTQVLEPVRDSVVCFLKPQAP